MNTTEREPPTVIIPTRIQTSGDARSLSRGTLRTQSGHSSCEQCWVQETWGVVPTAQGASRANFTGSNENRLRSACSCQSHRILTE